MAMGIFVLVFLIAGSIYLFSQTKPKRDAKKFKIYKKEDKAAEYYKNLRGN